MRTRMVGLALVVILLAVGGMLWWRRGGEDTSRSVATASDAASASKVQASPRPVAPEEPEAPETHDASEQQAHDERAQLEAIATELELTTQQRDRLIEILGEMQRGRRALFADLAARAIAVEEVSSKLRDLRETMHTAFAKEVGDEHAKRIRERMRVAHGGEPKN